MGARHFSIEKWRAARRDTERRFFDRKIFRAQQMTRMWPGLQMMMNCPPHSIR